MKADNQKIPEVLLYRGAWQEYPLDEIEIAVPLSPSDIELKREAIFMHESQKDEALFPGSDPREFWQRPKIAIAALQIATTKLDCPSSSRWKLSRVGRVNRSKSIDR